MHRTTLAPSKLELLTAWLPGRPWYRGAGEPELSRAGGFRLDDPAGEVGIELMLVNDGAGEPATYFVPLTYRAAPLPGAEHALVGTTEHGVLGTRWVYDAEHDPVATAQLLAFVAGAVEAQHQNESDTLDPSVGRTWDGGEVGAVLLVRAPIGGEAGTGRGRIEADWTAPDGSRTRGVVVVLR
ncbi:maltokinase N-terminal cap-like domain-containing protein [Blastococcus litoris]|uniref:maltokinase N-terminal cap-like domain-containing protein n=1 Tax=Blastococcus litoris TaxID=2171622 RepID=UPI001F12C803|nr:1,4-alpha-glucan branching protein [Blastococcus litoris]